MKCNLNCIHCGSVAGKARTNELTLHECLKISDEIIAIGCKEITFIGGEIFLFEGWEKIANHFSKNGLSVNLMSNGLNIKRKEIEQIKYANLSNVGISLDGPEKIHNSIRRNEKSYSGIINSFRALNRAGIPIAVVTTLLDINYGSLENLYKILIDNNVSQWQLQFANPMGNLAKKKDLIMKKKNIPSIINFIKEKNKEGKINILAADNIGYYYKDSEAYIRGTGSPLCYWNGCSAGISSVFIDSCGNVKGCGALFGKIFIEGNLKEKSLAEIWNDKNCFVYNRKFKTNMLISKCKNCDIKAICKGGCRTTNYYMTKSLYKNIICCH